MPRLRARRPVVRRAPDVPFVPADPAALGVPLDPSLAEIRSTLAGHRRRLWLRRAVRRFWAVAAVVAVAELVLAIAQRLVPLEQAPLVALAIPVVGAVVLLALVVLARPTLGETALAVDAEGGSGDAVLRRSRSQPRTRRRRGPPSTPMTARSRSTTASIWARPRAGSSAASAAMRWPTPRRGSRPVPAARGDPAGADRAGGDALVVPALLIRTPGRGDRAAPADPRGGRAPGGACR